MNPLFFRIFQHLLPRTQTWRLTISKTLRSFFQGLTGAPSDAVAYIDAVYEDAFPGTTRELAEWEAQFGLVANPDDAIRRLNLAAAWAAGGGQSPSYIQGVLQSAGFDLYVYEWWSSGPPYVARDPRLYTTQPLIGSVQCTAAGTGGQPVCTGAGIGGQPQCNRFLANDPHYLVNKDLTNNAPPPVPPRDADSIYWPYFLYVGSAIFPVRATIDGSRRQELETLLLKICPTHEWIVTLIDYVNIPLFLEIDSSDFIQVDGSNFAIVTTNP